MNVEENLRLHTNFLLLSFVEPNSSTIRQEKITPYNRLVGLTK